MSGLRVNFGLSLPRSASEFHVARILQNGALCLYYLQSTMIVPSTC